MTNPRETLARITYQRFFRRYLHLSGMTGTATEVADELWSVYRLKVSRIPTHKPAQRHEFKPGLMENQHHKWQSVVAAVQREILENKRPVLIGTRSVEASEQLSSYLTLAGVAHQVLNARQDAEEAQLIEQAGQANVVTVATNMAGRGTDMSTHLRRDAKKGLTVRPEQSKPRASGKALSRNRRCLRQFFCIFVLL